MYEVISSTPFSPKIKFNANTRIICKRLDTRVSLHWVWVSFVTFWSWARKARFPGALFLTKITSASEHKRTGCDTCTEHTYFRPDSALSSFHMLIHFIYAISLQGDISFLLVSLLIIFLACWGFLVSHSNLNPVTYFWLIYNSDSTGGFSVLFSMFCKNIL